MPLFLCLESVGPFIQSSLGPSVRACRNMSAKGKGKEKEERVVFPFYCCRRCALSTKKNHTCAEITAAGNNNGEPQSTDRS